jgi:hypothetical protein
MGKGRLLASVCALALIVAAPAFAADNSNSSTPGAATGAAPGAAPSPATGATPGPATGAAPGAAMSNPGGAAQPGGAASSATQNNPASANQAGTPQTRPSRRAMNRRRRSGREAMRQSRIGGDTSQNADVDRLNDQSLQAARRGEPFMGGNSNAPAEGTGGPGMNSAPPSGTKM